MVFMRRIILLGFLFLLLGCTQQPINEFVKFPEGDRLVFAYGVGVDIVLEDYETSKIVNVTNTTEIEIPNSLLFCYGSILSIVPEISSTCFVVTAFFVPIFPGFSKVSTQDPSVKKILEHFPDLTSQNIVIYNKIM